MKFNLRMLYLYLFSFVGLLITIIGTVQIVDLSLKTYVFRVEEYAYYPEPVTMDDSYRGPSEAEMKKRYEKEQENQRKRQMSTALAMIMVGFPVYLYHWSTIRKETKS